MSDLYHFLAHRISFRLALVTSRTGRGGSIYGSSSSLPDVTVTSRTSREFRTHVILAEQGREFRSGRRVLADMIRRCAAWRQRVDFLQLPRGSIAQGVRGSFNYLPAHLRNRLELVLLQILWRGLMRR